MSPLTQLVFIVTGASSGLGLHLSRAILAAGHKVVATMRDPTKTPDVVAEIEQTANGICAQLDVTDHDLEAKIEALIAKFGRVDVLVNNAGYGYGGALEDLDLVSARKQMETLFWGPVRAIRTVTPHMRRQESGYIINVSSTEGISGMPALSMYDASKFALEGLSEALHGELASFGIKTLIVQPGGMRTNFLSAGSAVQEPVSDAYKGTAVEYVMDAVRSTHGQQMLDPGRAAQRIVEYIDGGGRNWPTEREKYLRLPLGKEMLKRAHLKLQDLRENYDAMQVLAEGCDFDA